MDRFAAVVQDPLASRIAPPIGCGARHGFAMSSFGDVVPFAVPVAMSPLPIIAAVALLLAPAGTRGGVGFLIGRVAALAVCAFVVALFAVRVGDERGEAAERGGWLRIAAACW